MKSVLSFIVDSVNKKGNNINFFYSDTSKFYQPERHNQNYTLTFLTAKDYNKLTSDIDSIVFYVNMAYGTESEKVIKYKKEKLLAIIDNLNEPQVKVIIIELNRYNKLNYISKDGDKVLDLIYKLNMFFTQIIDPESWLGFDSHPLIWEFEYNKAGGHDLTSHLDMFNRILTDTSYIKNREVGKEIHRILLK